MLVKTEAVVYFLKNEENATATATATLETFRNFWNVLLVPSSKKQLFQQNLNPSVFSEEGYVRKKVKENLHRHNEKIYIKLKSDKIMAENFCSIYVLERN